MTYDIGAIYDNGVFRPLESLVIPDGTRVQLRIIDENSASEASASAKSVSAARRRADLDEFRRVVAELPVVSRDDGFSGADHDRLLYGEP